MINRLRIFSKIMLFALTSSLFAVNVTLNVDMSNVTVSDDGVAMLVGSIFQLDEIRK